MGQSSPLAGIPLQKYLQGTYQKPPASLAVLFAERKAAKRARLWDQEALLDEKRQRCTPALLPFRRNISETRSEFISYQPPQPNRFVWFPILS